ncbi:MAG: ATP-dependent Clp protease protease subunit [Myxococcota bacterium]|jgi:ATP-dependent Clp protease protease subunit
MIEANRIIAMRKEPLVEMPVLSDSNGRGEEDNWFNDRLFATRTVLLNSQIDGEAVRRVAQSMLILESADPEAPIDLVVSSYGGSDTAGFALYDLIRFMKAPVRAIASGIVGGIAALVYVAAEKENRLALPNVRFLLHQPQRGSFGATSDLEIAASELMKTQQQIISTLAEATGQSAAQVHKDTHRKLWLDVQEAHEYGLVTRIVTRRAELTS